MADGGTVRIIDSWTVTRFGFAWYVRLYGPQQQGGEGRLCAVTVTPEVERVELAVFTARRQCRGVPSRETVDETFVPELVDGVLASVRRMAVDLRALIEVAERPR